VIEAISPDHLIVVGIAGGIGAEVGIGDLVVPEIVANLDTGDEFHPAPLGDTPQRGILVSSDTLIESPEQVARLRERGVVAIDMETAAIAAECESCGCRWSVFRAISDIAADGTTDAAILGLIDSDGRPRPAALARFVLTHPTRIPTLIQLARGTRTATDNAARAACAAIASLDAGS